MPNFQLPDRIEAGRSALIVVDIQDKFRDIIHGMNEVISASRRMIKFSQELDIPVLVTEHYPRGLGTTQPRIRELFNPFQPIEKIEFSCCGSDLFSEILEQLDRDQIILVGIETHVCIYQTAFDLMRIGKQVVVPADAVSSCSAANRELGLQRMTSLGVQIMGVQMLMFEILKKAGTPQFKKVAPLLKE